MFRVHFLIKLAVTVVSILAANSSFGQSAKSPLPKVGFLIGVGFPQNIEVFQNELGRVGFKNGVNVDFKVRECRAGTNDLAAAIANFKSDRVAVVVVPAITYAIAVRKADPTMPLVIVTSPGIVRNGFGKSLKRPGGVSTGIDELPPGLTAARLKLLKMAAPKIKRVALLSTTPGVGNFEAQYADASRTAKKLHISVKSYRATNLAELNEALTRIGVDKPDALLNFQGGLSLSNRQLIIDFADKHRLPAIYQATLFVESGGLMAWAPDLKEQFRISARIVARIMRGEKAGDIPISYPPKYFLTIHAGTAKKLGLNLPKTLLSKAYRVIR